MLTLTDVTDIKHLSETAINPNRCAPDPRARHIWYCSAVACVSPHRSFSSSIKPFAQPPYPSISGPVPQSLSSEYQTRSFGVAQNWKVACSLIILCVTCHPGYEPLAPPPAPTATAVPVWQDRTIASSKLRMLEYSAFMEVQRDPDNVSQKFTCKTPHL